MTPEWFPFQNAYTHHKEVIAAQGVKIIAKDLEKGLAGLPMYVAHGLDEVEVYKVGAEKKKKKKLFNSFIPGGF